MKRLHRVARIASLIAAFVAAAAAFTAFTAPSSRAAAGESAAVTCADIAAQLGVKIPPGSADIEFRIGVQFTGTLEDTAKIIAFGIKGMHAGARVTVLRQAPERVYVEADELMPPSRASVKLRIDAQGRLQTLPRV